MMSKRKGKDIFERDTQSKDKWQHLADEKCAKLSEKFLQVTLKMLNILVHLIEEVNPNVHVNKGGIALPGSPVRRKTLGKFFTHWTRNKCLHFSKQFFFIQSGYLFSQTSYTLEIPCIAGTLTLHHKQANFSHKIRPAFEPASPNTAGRVTLGKNLNK